MEAKHKYFRINPIGFVRSDLKRREDAPRQGREDAPNYGSSSEGRRIATAHWGIFYSIADRPNPLGLHRVKV
jgi:tRNA (Thr-GGU) A37 N-methylase